MKKIFIIYMVSTLSLANALSCSEKNDVDDKAKNNAPKQLAAFFQEFHNYFGNLNDNNLEAAHQNNQADQPPRLIRRNAAR